MPRRFLAISGLSLLLGLIIYAPFLRAPYFSDDLLFYFKPPAPHWYTYFVTVGPALQAYRPLEAAILTQIQLHFGFETWPIHVISLAALTLLSGLTWLTAVELGYSSVAAYLSCAIVVISQIAEPAVLGNDTMSQAASALLGAAGAYLFWRATNTRSVGFHLASLACYFAALFFKETALGYCAVIAVLAFALLSDRVNVRHSLIRLTRALLPYALATLIYLAARIYAGGPVGSAGSYRISLGTNVIANLALSAVAAISPISTVSSAVSVQTRNFAAMIGIVAAVGVMCAIALAGFAVSTRRRLMILLAACAVASLFPTFLLQHVSELYVYNAMPFVALLLAAVLADLWAKGTLGQFVVLASAVLFISGQLVAVHEKSKLMFDNGVRAAAMMNDLAADMRSLPANSTILLADAEKREPKYSVFVLHGFDVLEFGAPRLGAIYDRPDIAIEITPESAIYQFRGKPNVFVARLVNGRLQPLAPVT